MKLSIRHAIATGTLALGLCASAPQAHLWDNDARTYGDKYAIHFVAFDHQVYDAEVSIQDYSLLDGFNFIGQWKSATEPGRKATAGWLAFKPGYVEMDLYGDGNLQAHLVFKMRKDASAGMVLTDIDSGSYFRGDDGMGRSGVSGTTVTILSLR